MSFRTCRQKLHWQALKLSNLAIGLVNELFEPDSQVIFKDAIEIMRFVVFDGPFDLPSMEEMGNNMIHRAEILTRSCSHRIFIHMNYCEKIAKMIPRVTGGYEFHCLHAQNHPHCNDSRIHVVYHDLDTPMDGRNADVDSASILYNFAVSFFCDSQRNTPCKVGYDYYKVCLDLLHMANHIIEAPRLSGPGLPQGQRVLIAVISLVIKEMMARKEFITASDRIEAIRLRESYLVALQNLMLVLDVPFQDAMLSAAAA